MFKSLFVYMSVFLSASLYAASFQGLGDLPGGPVYSEAWSMSSDGKVVVGESRPADGFDAFRWTAEDGMVAIDGFSTTAKAASGDGTVIVGRGSMVKEDVSTERAFMWTQANGVVELPTILTVNNNTFEYRSAVANGISANGSVIIGTAATGTHTDTMSARPCYWENGQFNTLVLPDSVTLGLSQASAVSDDGSIILINTGGASDFLWSQANGFTVLPAEAKGAHLMSDDAQVFAGGRNPFIWSQEKGLTQIGIADGWFENHLHTLSSDGTVAGGQLIKEFSTSYDPQNLEAYIWDEVNGIRFVKDILTGYGINLNGWELTDVSSISHNGSIICGNGVNPNGFEEAWIVTIPEPATILLTLSGALIAFRRKSVR